MQISIYIVFHYNDIQLVSWEPNLFKVALSIDSSCKIKSTHYWQTILNASAGTQHSHTSHKLTYTHQHLHTPFRGYTCIHAPAGTKIATGWYHLCSN